MVLRTKFKEQTKAVQRVAKQNNSMMTMSMANFHAAELRLQRVVATTVFSAGSWVFLVCHCWDDCHCFHWHVEQSSISELYC